MVADILFETDNATVDGAAADAVRKVVEFAKANGNVVIRLDGHADPRGTAPHNMELSRKRVDAVRKALVDAGVPGDRIEVVAFGEARSKCAETDEGCLQAARRVAVFFIVPSETSAASIRTDGKSEVKKERSR
jgi:outer membrane protein OmpA-like peptidoglycan-associated protein